jgi:LysM repeat protein
MMKLPKLPVRKKLRASTARRSFSDADEMDEMSEPNMKLSRALLIVLVLHVVAVAGIIAFNTIKSRQGTLAPAGETAAATPARSTATPPTGPAANAAAVVANQAPLPQGDSSKPAEQSIPRALPVSSSDTARTYTVAPGDNPVKIARQLNVSKDELLALNKITDPTKLQIGQKLQVPTRTLSKPAAAKTTTAKTTPKATPKPSPKATPKSSGKTSAKKKKN